MITRSRFCGPAPDASRCGPLSLRSEVAALDRGLIDAGTQASRANARIDLFIAEVSDKAGIEVTDTRAEPDVTDEDAWLARAEIYVVVGGTA